MCGIVGYVGFREATPILLDGLTKLEYRGYDSAGIAVFEHEKGIVIEKSVGRLSSLQAKLAKKTINGNVGIGHTRWATHGSPSDENSHPHCDCSGEFVVVHNGIIENYISLKEDLQAKGHVFKSETDTEVIAHLLEEIYDGDLLRSTFSLLEKIDGAYALVIMAKSEPDKLICTKKDNPMVLGLGENENFIASDIPAIVQYTKNTYILNDGELAVLTDKSISFFDNKQNKIEKKIYKVYWNAEAAEKCGYEHFMLKEIYEQPKAIRDTMRGRLQKDNKGVFFEELGWTKESFVKFNKIIITACGTAYYAGTVGRYYLEQLAKLPIEMELASEFRHRELLIDDKTLLLVISQSGETIDTLSALKFAKAKGAATLAITNVVGSSIARECDQVVYTWAGPEIAVASTKAYTTQVVTLCMLAIYMAQLKGTINSERVLELVEGLKNLPSQLHEVFEEVSPIKTFASLYYNSKDVFFLGRSLDYAIALEGALKLKEISYIHAEAYAAGELKHGTLALVEEGVPVIALATQREVFEKMMSNVKEVKARGAIVIGIAMQGDVNIDKYVDHAIFIPVADKYLVPILAVVPLQLIAYYAAVNRGCDVDKPRNLAKSVTVE